MKLSSLFNRDLHANTTYLYISNTNTSYLRISHTNTAYLYISHTKTAPPPNRIRMMANTTKNAIMCRSALLFLRALRALLSILLRGASSRVVGTSCTGSMSLDFVIFRLNGFFSPCFPAELIFLRNCSSGLLWTGWK